MKHGIRSKGNGRDRLKKKVGVLLGRKETGTRNLNFSENCYNFKPQGNEPFKAYLDFQRI